MVLNPRKCELMGFEKTNENDVFPIMKSDLKKQLLPNYLVLQ